MPLTVDLLSGREAAGYALRWLLAAEGVPIPVYFAVFSRKKGISRAFPPVPDVASDRSNPTIMTKGYLIQTKIVGLWNKTRR